MGETSFSSSEAWTKLTRGCAEIISEKELRTKLALGRPLRIKMGVDPTAPDLHLGHLVVLKKLRDFQEAGHHIDFLIGDFTARVGDPTGRSETRPPLTPQQVAAHAKTYQEQVFRVLDREKTRVCFNSEWFDAMSPMEYVLLAQHASVAQMLKRADFKKRLEQESDLSMLEFMYPIFQGFDSYKLQSDVELGGTDQKFNLLMGREIQRDYKQELQVVLMMPLLEGLDGVKKMSKSYGNYVAFNDSAKDQFGKLMSVPDALMLKYAELLTDLDLEPLKTMHPRDAKALLARTIVSQFHGVEAATEAEAEFVRVFSKKEIPAEIPEFQAARGSHKVADLLVAASVTSSKKEAQRLLSQGAVEIEGQRKAERDTIDLQTPMLAQVGKRRFIRFVPV